MLFTKSWAIFLIYFMKKYWVFPKNSFLDEMIQESMVIRFLQLQEGLGQRKFQINPQKLLGHP